ncbi:MAG: ABC transporter permease [Myxococcales bacterium]|nr:MAG: ABC transporter permease [Myxococcales bacterium]
MDKRAWRRFRKNKGALVGAILVGIITGLAFIGPYIAPFDPNQQFRDEGLDEQGAPVAPNRMFLLGADPIGRDQLSRLLHGGRISLQVAFFATLLATAIGLFIGITAGYFGGMIDSLSMRGVDLLLSLPFLIIAIAIKRVIARPDLWTLYLLLGFLSWTTLARIVRAKTIQIREQEFILATHALGMSHARILVRHVLPNVLGPTIVIATTMVAQMIIVESAMSFLGLGVEPPQASWGSMLHDAQEMLAHFPRLAVQPGLLILATVFGFNLLGEGLRDALDPNS